MVKGNDILILMDGVAIAGCRSHRVQTQCSTIEKASSTQQAWEEYEPGRKGWNVAVNYLVTLVANIDDVLKVGSKVTILIRDRNNSKSISGTAIVVSCETQYTRGNLATGSYQFKGTGALS